MAGWTLYTGDARSSEATVFALGAMVFGFGLLGWSGRYSPAAASSYAEHMAREATDRTRFAAQDTARGCGGGIMVWTRRRGVTLVARGPHRGRCRPDVVEHVLSSSAVVGSSASPRS